MKRPTRKEIVSILDSVLKVVENADKNTRRSPEVEKARDILSREKYYLEVARLMYQG